MVNNMQKNNAYFRGFNCKDFDAEGLSSNMIDYIIVLLSIAVTARGRGSQSTNAESAPKGQSNLSVAALWLLT
jgi:hypothetical protein